MGKQHLIFLSVIVKIVDVLQYNYALKKTFLGNRTGNVSQQFSRGNMWEK